jgi:glyoxylate reductase
MTPDEKPGVRAVAPEIRMSPPRLNVVVTCRLPDVVETRLKELFDVTLRDGDTKMTREELADAMRHADVLVPTITDSIDAALIGQAGDRLKLIASYGAGVDHIDVATARSRGILVSNTPGVVTDDTADMVMALILLVTRRIPQGLAASGGTQAGHPRDGAYRAGCGAPRARLRSSGSLQQSQASSPGDRGGT